MVEISVIMPAYNAVDYLDEAIGSIINQSFRDLEIICVDDGSTDNTLERLNSFAAKDDRIQVYTQENRGPGGATNYGLSKANGKYIYLMDSDDILDLHALEEFYNLAEEKDIDMIIFPAMDYDEDTGEYSKDSYVAMTEFSAYIDDSIFHWKDIGDYIFKISVTPWSKFYKHELIKKSGAQFTVDLIYHDNTFFWEVLFTSDRLLYYDKPLYTRRVHSKSCTNSMDERNIHTIKINNLITQVFIDYGHFEEFKEILYNRKVDIVDYRYRLIRDEFKELFFVEMKKDFMKILDHEKYDDFYSSLHPKFKLIFNSVITSSNHVEYDLRMQNHKLLVDIDRLKKEIASIENKNAKLNGKNNELKEMNESLLSSRSWKMTCR